MFRSLTALLVPLVLLLAGSSGHASVILRANLTNDQEDPPASPLLTTAGDPRPISFGKATFVLNDAMDALTFTATVFNIDVTGTQTADTNDNLVAAHIHASDNPFPTAPVVWGFFGMPFNDTTPTDTVLTPFATGVGGVFTSKWDLPEGNGGTTLAEQLPRILSGRSYLNFHTMQFPRGEIRGQLTVVPEPSTMTLLGMGGFGLVGSAIRKRRLKSK